LEGCCYAEELWMVNVGIAIEPPSGYSIRWINEIEGIIARSIVSKDLKAISFDKLEIELAIEVNRPSVNLSNTENCSSALRGSAPRLTLKPKTIKCMRVFSSA